MKERFSEIVKVKGKSFRYDYEKKLVQYVFIIEEDDEVLGWKKGNIDVIDEVGLREENWNNKNNRKQYLIEYACQLEEEVRWLI